MEQNKTGKYLKYAIGEIVLVVIGILIALSINNWNEENKLRKREINLLSELKSNLFTNAANLENDVFMQNRGVKSIDYIINIGDNNLPYNDSIPSILFFANLAHDIILVSSAFETLKTSGLELIQQDSLRIEIINLYEFVYPKLMQETIRLEDQLWPALVMPLYQKHFRSKGEEFHPIDYNNWLKDKEFFNMLSFRKTLREVSTELKSDASKRTKDVIKLIEKEINSLLTEILKIDPDYVI